MDHRYASSSSEEPLLTTCLLLRRTAGGPRERRQFQTSVSPHPFFTKKNLQKRRKCRSQKLVLPTSLILKQEPSVEYLSETYLYKPTYVKFELLGDCSLYTFRKLVPSLPSLRCSLYDLPGTSECKLEPSCEMAVIYPPDSSQGDAENGRTDRILSRSHQKSEFLLRGRNYIVYY